MTKFIAIILTAATLGIWLLVSLLGGPDGPAYEPAEIRLAPRDEGISILDQQTQSAETIRAAVTARFTDAPAEIVDLAAKIANPRIALDTYANDIRALSAEVVNASYGTPVVETDYTHTLLREAVLSGNTTAAALLIDRGADTSYNDNEMPFQAVRLADKSRDYQVWFPDYRSGAKFLTMWLADAETVQITHPLHGGGIGTLLMHTPIDNLEGIMMLLKAGADPWSLTEVRAPDGGFLYAIPGFFETLARPDPISAEVTFRLAREGFYDNPPEESALRIAAQYRAIARQLSNASSPEDLALAWTMQRAIAEVYKAFGQRGYDSDINNLMRLRIDRMIGGFFLAPGEIRSPDIFDQRVDSARQFGRQKWPVRN